MSKDDASRLWYRKPAKKWTQSLLIGNGKIGAAIMGGVEKENIYLNENTLWSGLPYDNSKQKNKSEIFNKARSLALSGELACAQELLENEFADGDSSCYLLLGNLHLTFRHKGIYKNYKRVLDLNESISTVCYTADKTEFKREYFLSYPSNALCVHLTCDGSAKLNFSVTISSELKGTVSVNNNTIFFDGECPLDVTQSGAVYDDKTHGINFSSGVKICTDSGEIKCNKNNIHVSGAREAVLYFSCETSFKRYDLLPDIPHEEVKKSLDKTLDALSLGCYETIKKEHINDYKNYYDRVKLDLGSTLKVDTPTDKRLSEFKYKKNDLSLYTLLFNFGRYLLISASRQGTQAMNLQGIWTYKMFSPWRSNYTVNINTQMNYWPALMCSMPELNMPLIDLINDIADTGEKTARDFYDFDGFCCHHNVDIWRKTSPAIGNAQWMFWPMAGAWFCRHAFEHYEYTNDTGFLRETAYPVMKKAAEFCLDYLVQDEDGYLIAAPSTSPENNFIIDGKEISLSQTSTMTMAIIKDLFLNCISACETLLADEDFAKKLKDAYEKMLPFKIGGKGHLLEWYKDEEEADIHHRHISHLYALHPARLITPYSSPQLADAAKKTLEIRGDEGTGWSKGWKINMWARFFDGNHALTLLDNQLRHVKTNSHGGGTYSNMLDAHPPFQIDGNFGAVSGITEMLMQSEKDMIFILPALPRLWEKGSIFGLSAKGGVNVDIVWENHELKEVNLKNVAKKTKIIYNSKNIEIDRDTVLNQGDFI